MNIFSRWLDFFYRYRFEIVFIFCLILLILYFIFKEQIDNYLSEKTDWELPYSLKTNRLKRYPEVQLKKRPKIIKKYEQRCRQIFQNIFQKSFPSVRPKFLKRANGRCLELDGWNPELGLAFEYNGIQHYKLAPRFHKTHEDFKQQLQRDREKREMCLKNNVVLIELPYKIKYDILET